MRILGLTGDIACGKSTVAQLLRERGAETLDSDLLVRELYNDAVFSLQVAALFETSVLDDEGHVDRNKLGAEVFTNAEKLRRLEFLVHPAVARLRGDKLRELAFRGTRVVVIEAVKLLESGQGSGCEEIWCVVCAPEVQVQRMVSNRGLTEEAARSRLQSQPSRSAKTVLAQGLPLIWIENDGNLKDLAALVAGEWTRFAHDAA